jgi:hypothetical protein
VHGIAVSLVQRRLASWPAPLATGPVMLQLPQGRLEAPHESPSVIVPLLTNG